MGELGADDTRADSPNFSPGYARGSKHGFTRFCDRRMVFTFSGDGLTVSLQANGGIIDRFVPISHHSQELQLAY
jgi:hypothetical protein